MVKNTKYIILVLIIIYNLIACQNIMDIDEVNNHTHHKNFNSTGEDHNELLNNIYTHLENDYNNGVKLNANNIDTYMEDLFINVVAKDMNLADIDEYEAHKSIYFNVDFSNFEETVFDSVDVAITRMYNSVMLSSDEADAIRDLAKILETYDSSTFDVFTHTYFSKIHDCLVATFFLKSKPVISSPAWHKA